MYVLRDLMHAAMWRECMSLIENDRPALRTRETMHNAFTRSR